MQGTQAFSGALGTGTSPIWIGGQGTSYSLDGEIAEVLIFNRALTELERNLLSSYFYQRYSLGTSPATEVLTEDQLSPRPGIYTGAQTVSVTVPAGVTLRYTTNGSDPDENSAIYTGPISVSSTTTLKMRAYRNGFQPSAVTSATYTIDPSTSFTREGLMLWLRGDTGVVTTNGTVSRWSDVSGTGNHATQVVGAAQPTLVTLPVNQLGGKPVLRFDGVNDLLTVPDNASVRVDQMTVVMVMKANPGGDPTWGVFFRKGTGYGIELLNGPWGFFANQWTAAATTTQSPSNYMVVEGTYDRAMQKLFINGNVVGSTAMTDAVAQNSYPLAIGGLYNSSYLASMDVAEVMLFNKALSDLERKQVELYLYNRYQVGAIPTEATPAEDQLSPRPGIYTGAQTVSVTVPAGVTLRYTTNGSDPDENSAIYTGPISVSSTTTLKMRAYRNGFQPSAVTSATYTIDGQADIPRDGLISWLRADVGMTLSGNSVTKWADQSGSLNHANGFAGYYPSLVGAQLNGKPVVRFNRAGSQFVRIENNAAMNPAQVTIIAVAKQTVDSPTSIVVQKIGGGGNQYALYYPNGYTATMISGAGSASGTQPMGNFGVLIGSYDGGSLKMRVSGNLTGNTTYTGGLGVGTEPVYIGGYGASYGMTGDIAELLMFNKALTDSERQAVEAYLYFRYGVGPIPVVPTPVVTSEAIFNGQQSVNLSQSLNGATIRYTLDGSDPTETSTEFVPGTPLVLTQTTTVKARAFKSGYTPSAVSAATFTQDSTANFPRLGLKAWLRADAGVNLSGNGVQTWRDQSGAGNDAVQPLAVSQPVKIVDGISDKPAIRFDGSNDFLSIPDSADIRPDQLTLYVVARNNGGGTSGAVVYKSTAAIYGDGYGLVKQGSGDSLGFFINNNQTTRAQGTAALGQWFQSTSLYNQGQLSQILNGRFYGAYSYTQQITQSTEPLRIGGNGVNANSFGGDVQEVLLFNRALTVPEQIAVEKYLDVRYGISTDSDNDGLQRWKELEIGTNPSNPDTNGNGIPDGLEFRLGYDPTNTDSDGDGVPDGTMRLSFQYDPVGRLTGSQQMSGGAEGFGYDANGSVQTTTGSGN